MRFPALIALAVAAPCLFAHDIPADIAVRMFVVPHNQTLRVLVRLPLTALRDIDVARSLPGIQQQLPDAAQVWVAGFLDLREDGNQLPKLTVAAAQLSLPSDRSFDDFETALAHTTGPRLDAATAVPWNQLFADVLLTVPIHRESSRIAIQPRLRTLAARVVATMRFRTPAAPERAIEFTGDPGWIELDPSWTEAAFRFVRLGFEHILDGTDHLLFLFCLVLPVRRLRPLVLVVTAFTVAHSITLISSAFDLAPSALWFPPLVETLIAASIVYMGLENILSDTPRHHRWALAFGFGLVHGFGFSFALKKTLQFAGRHLVSSLLAFNVGVELGQIAVLIVLVPALTIVFRYAVAERMGIIVASALVVHTAWHWMTERYEVLRKYEISLTGGDAAIAVRWAFVLVLLGGIGWLVSSRRAGSPDPVD